MPDTVESITKQIKGLTQYRKLTSEKLKEAAEKILEDKDKKDKDPLNIEMFFEKKSEKKAAQKLLKKYLDNYSIETISDKQVLIQLIFLEIIHFRLMESANKSQDDNGATPGTTIKSIHENIREIINLKNQLGIGKKSGNDDSVSGLDTLRKKYLLWMSENVACRQFICPACSQMILLKIKIDQYDASLHPHFKDRTLFNEEMARLYLEGTISSQNVAKMLDCSEFYCDWMIKKMWPTNPKYDEMKKEIESNPDLEISEVTENIDVKETEEIKEEVKQ